MNEKILNALACPRSGQPLEWDRANGRLINRTEKLFYPIINGIPVLLPEQAQPLEEAQ